MFLISHSNQAEASEASPGDAVLLSIGDSPSDLGKSDNPTEPYLSLQSPVKALQRLARAA